MNPMIMQLKISLGKLEKEYQEYKLKSARLMYELQSNTNPYFGDDLELFKAEEIEQIGDEMVLVKKAMIDLRNKIKKIKTDLEE